MENNFYCVSGYGWSGSGAVVDLLKEYEGFKAIGSEYPLISEPHGIIDLEIFLVQNWHFLRHDRAIRDFISFCHKLDKKQSKFNATGLNLSEKLSVDFIKQCELFLNRIIDFTYEGRSRINLYQLNKLEVFIKKFMWKFFNKNSVKMHFSKPLEEKFIEEIQNFHLNIFESFFKNGYNHIILDQAVPLNHVYRSLRYFKNSKLIIVDRDPRDIYADLIRSNGLIGTELSKLNIESVDKFIKWHFALRQTSDEFYSKDLAANILKINFEDLIINFKKTNDIISNFIGPEIEHKNALVYFKPKLSEKNIGMWKNIPNQELIQYIKKKIDYPYFD